MVLFVLILNGFSSGHAADAEPAPTGKKPWKVYTEWPFSAAEAKRRQEETAKALGIPVEKTLDLGNGVSLELVLIPAGRFIMGTSKPVEPDWAALDKKIMKGQVILGIGVLAFMVMVLIMVVRSIRQKRRPQMSLRAFILKIFALSVAVLGAVDWNQGLESKSAARLDYEADISRFKYAFSSEMPGHAVTLSKPFYMGKYEVTQEQYERVMWGNLSFFKGRSRPVETVLWNGAQLFCIRVGEGVRLPSEAEWEYACRAGAITIYSSGDREADLLRVGWYERNSHWKTHPVGTKESNAFGLYDMQGNVLEWCEDNWHSTYEGAPCDGSAWVDSERNKNRVCRGGAWVGSPDACRCSYRFSLTTDDHDGHLGFRVSQDLK